MKQLLPFLLFFLISSFSFSQNLEPFSEINELTNNFVFNSIANEDGLIYFLENGEENKNKLVQINYDGEIINEVFLPTEDSLTYDGYLAQDGDRIYLVGHQRLYYENIAPPLFWNNQRRSVIEFNTNLEIQEIHTFDIVPFGGGEQVGISGTFVGVNNPSTVHVVDGLVYANWPIPIFNTSTNEYIGNVNQFELMDLDAAANVVKPLTDVVLNLGAVFRENDFLIYGDIADTIVDGTSLNSRPLARYDYNGEKLETLFFDQFGSGAFSDGCSGQLHNSLLYSTYYGRDEMVEGGCTGNTATIEIRNQDLELLNAVKVPECDVVPFGKNPFAFNENNDLYFTTVQGEAINVYKYDNDLNLLWSETITAPQERPISLKSSPDGGVIVECFLSGGAVTTPLLKLYAVNPEGDMVGLSELELSNLPEVFFGPNPATDFIYPIVDLEEPIALEFFSTDGRLIFSNNGSSDEVDVTALQGGSYILRVVSEESGRVLGTQVLIKADDN